MLDIGKTYNLFTTSDAGNPETWRDCKAVEEHLPIVKFEQHGKHMIMNMSAPEFIRAEEAEEKSEARE